ncbi:hypothetical protein, partial [Acetomicrobium sp. S15 = DSM 107314]|uniref:hypothetical protein n=1 Tax=Acetomicrobium sp. S15 = DSM 107314 TaxID=2529858 RepID=UPI0031596BD3
NLHDTPSMVKPQTERSTKASKTMIKAQDLWKEFPNGVQAGANSGAAYGQIPQVFHAGRDHRL